ncbi:hypothetical protein V2J09_011929 [Rumex salicifolius]
MNYVRWCVTSELEMPRTKLTFLSREILGFLYRARFGSGRRMCPGMGLVTSIVEPSIAIRWSLPDGKKSKYLDMREASGLIVHKNKPLFAVASPRI